MIDGYLLWSFVAFCGLLLFSAFFSSSETALFSLTRSQISEILNGSSEDSRARVLAKLLKDPRKLLISLLTGNTIVNILAATVAALATSRLVAHFAISEWAVYVIQGVVVTLVILIGAEILPKFAAVRNPLSFSLAIAAPLNLLTMLMYPITALITPIADGIARGLGVEKKKLWISEEEIKTLLEVGEEHGALEKSERDMIHSIFELGEITVREIMVPRTDMIAIEVKTPISKVLDTLRKCGHSRIPVFDERVDNIIGILHAKDLMTFYPFKDEVDLRRIIRAAHFVPEAKTADELLKQFQEQRVHMSIAVDEYGGTAGLVTLEDVIEEIVGEIQDEHDAERDLWTRIDENTVLIDAKLDVETVNEVLDDDVIPIDDDFDTLGGFLLSEIGDFPEAHTIVEYHNYEFIIEEVRKHRLGRVRVVRREAISDNNE
ncbi:MAG: HlyC/CorC family transporter [Calditrichaeota bacterium]|nr:HlyC/CorC family transporter [Calditrichota bacterium]MCB9368655.1 HlyC/CorC family transporter [Calditrichota bacterium]